jgi:glycine/D-amino acid oxidase-like deaminating enzyme/nitrite reductase/ring-hydroxylating ferredoxin subunit
METEVLPDAPRLKRTMQCDTVIVGAGIAGLSTAYELAGAGQKVVVVDRGSVAGGMTSRTTAHLAPICDDGIATLISLRGEEMAKLFQQSQEAAVASIEKNVGSLGIDCDFRRLDGFLFPGPGMTDGDARQHCEREHEAAGKAMAAVERAKGAPFKGFEDAPILRYPNQATFHPLKYLKGLAASILARDGFIFARSAAMKVEEGHGNVRVTTEMGHTIEAANAIFATNAPVNNRVTLHSKMAPYRTYAMAFTLPHGALADALYWDMADPYHYVRLQPGPGATDYLIAGGADHRSGEADDGYIRFQALEAWMRNLLPDLGEQVNRWSGQVMETVDHCGFIGRNPGNNNVYVATGDSGQGMTHGALAGIMLRDLIMSGSSPWETVYDPSRAPLSAAANYLRENLTAFRNFAEYLMPGELKSADELRPGQGGILRSGLATIAVCRDLDSKVHAHSASYTHLGCHIHWNSTEQCWDCPCHGSQFAPDGTVLNGPAISPLAKAELPSKARAA